MTMSFDHSAEKFTDHLRDGESLIWSGKPDPKIFFNATDITLAPIALTLLAFALLSTYLSSGGTFPPSIDTFSLTPFLLALYIGIVRLFVRRRRKDKIWYGVSNQRAIIVNDLGNVRFIDLKGFIYDSRVASDNNSISVAFRSPNSPSAGRAGYIDLYLEGTPNFLLARMNSTIQVKTVGPAIYLNPKSIVFVDVTDVTGLLAALNSVTQVG